MRFIRNRNNHDILYHRKSYRNIIPKVREIHTMKELINEEYDLKILCSTKENLKTIKNVLQNSTKCDKIIITQGNR